MLRGRCACSSVGYEVADAFSAAFNCHCSNCRALTGSAFLPWGEIEREKLRVNRGADDLFVDGDPDGMHAMRCRNCWSLLYWTARDGLIRVPYGTLVDAPTLKPTAHIFVGSKAPWYDILDDLPRHDEYPWPMNAEPASDRFG
ncbi:MAG TPA: GFA family protein [Gaiellaceae bacterium]|nr:GFA family protein [Gaiellaceae bacterium]